ncbi:hypothetical protein GGR56DRAFT_649148 [Xylariaceae sp. FL0804]|nr:hypothetical protein GGR56DRAFT_649148 [Xylariaceae sp. FL0804]
MSQPDPDGLPTQVDGDEMCKEPVNTKTQQTPATVETTTLLDLQHHAVHAKSYELRKELKRARSYVYEMEVKLRQIEWYLDGAREAQKTVETEWLQHQAKFEYELTCAGISCELWQAYEAFCKSLEPHFAIPGRWRVTCSAPHGGSYVRYDPELDLFRESSEIPPDSCNFFCHPSSPGCNPSWKEGDDDSARVVNFWPISGPNFPSGAEQASWRVLYPVLYDLAMSAARDGSRAAMDMLVALPDMDEASGSGWLFEYAFEPEWKHHPIQSRRWTFRSAHRIDAPTDDARKRRRLERQLVRHMSD